MSAAITRTGARRARVPFRLIARLRARHAARHTVTSADPAHDAAVTAMYRELARRHGREVSR